MSAPTPSSNVKTYASHPFIASEGVENVTVTYRGRNWKKILLISGAAVEVASLATFITVSILTEYNLINLNLSTVLFGISFPICCVAPCFLCCVACLPPLEEEGTPLLNPPQKFHTIIMTPV